MAPVEAYNKKNRDAMPKPYEHQFGDLNSDAGEPSPSVVDLGPEPTKDGEARPLINKPPGNPEAGKEDQFGDISPAPKDEVDEGIDVDVEGAVADDATTSDDDDLADVPRSTRERIQRERRLRQEAEERSRRVEAELAQISRKLDLNAKESEWSSADAKDEADLQALKDQKAKALEEGKTVDVVEIDDKISDLKANKLQRERERKAAREEAAKPAPKEPAATNEKAAAWIKKHPAYNSDPLFKEAANAADRLLFAQGFNSQTDEYYTELSRLLARSGKFEIDPSYLKPKSKRSGAGGLGSGAVRRGDGQVRRQDNGRVTVTITKEEKTLLAQMGQDPEDPAVLRSFAREKVALQRAEAARGDR